MIKLTNNLTAKKEIFIPIKDKEVSMYVCGVTLYDNIHVGHLKSILTFEVLRNYFKEKGFKVKFVRNITDIDDKIIKKALELNEDPLVLVNLYIEIYHNLLSELEINKPDIEPRVTEYLNEIIEYVENLKNKGFAYQAEDGIYFDTDKIEHEIYPLSKKVISELQESEDKARQYKRKGSDFALWKRDETYGYQNKHFHTLGRPGWHIECSVMHHHTLGEKFDLHGGGRDLIFPHHENEITQSHAHNGVNPANYWIHNGMMTKNGKKLSKSEGNSIYVKDIIKKYSKEGLKLFLAKGQYNQSQEYNEEELLEAHQRFLDFSSIMNDLRFNDNYHSIFNEVIEALEDDLNTPKVVVLVYAAMKELKTTLSFQQANEIIKVLKLLSVIPEKLEVFDLYLRWKEYNKPSKEILEKFEERNKAKNSKNFALSDAIRKELKDLGWSILDKKEGSILLRD